MDPDATYLQLIESIAAGELDEAADRAFALSEWLDLGGFAPAALARAAVTPHHLLLTAKLLAAARDLNDHG